MKKSNVRIVSVLLIMCMIISQISIDVSASSTIETSNITTTSATINYNDGRDYSDYYLTLIDSTGTTTQFHSSRMPMDDVVGLSPDTTYQLRLSCSPDFHSAVATYAYSDIDQKYFRVYAEPAYMYLQDNFSIADEVEMYILGEGLYPVRYTDNSTIHHDPIIYVYSAPYTTTVVYGQLKTNALVPNFTITATAVGPGTVTPDTTTVPYGTPVTLLARPSAGAYFSHWEYNGNDIGQFTMQADGSSEFTLGATLNSDYTAVFKYYTAYVNFTATNVYDPEIYRLDPYAMGSGPYNQGDTIIFEVKSDRYVEWAGVTTSNNDTPGVHYGYLQVPTNLTSDMVYNVSATAGAQAIINLDTNAGSYSLTNQDGTITGPGPYNPGDEVTITIDRFYNSDDITWTLAIPTSDNANTATITIPSDLTTTVTYTPSATLYAFMSVEGNLEGSSDNYTEFYSAEYGVLFNHPVNQYDGYGGVEWLIDGALHPRFSHIRFDLLNLLDGPGDPIVIDGPHNFNVYHYKIHNITSSTNGVGSVSPMTSGVCGYDYLTITAENTQHGTFSHWLKDGAPIDFTNSYFTETATANGSELKVIGHDADAHYTAVFTPVIYTVNVSVDPDSNAGSATVTPSSGSNADDFTLTATANPGYDFVQWLDKDLSPITSGVTNPLTLPFEMDTSYTAEFNIRSLHNISTQVQNNNGTGIGNSASITLDSTTGIEVPAGSGHYTVGSELTLTAISSSDYGFMGWVLNGETISPNPTTTVTVRDSDAQYTAVFELGYYNVNATPNIAARGSVTLTGSPVLSGNEVTLVASSNAGHFFKKFVDANTGVTLGTSASLTLVPRANMDIIAVFDTNPSNDDPYAPGPNANTNEDDVNNDPDPEEGTPENAGDDDLDSNPDTADDNPIGDDEIPASGPSDEASDLPSNKDVSGPDEVANVSEDDQDVLNGSVPEGTPNMPQTSGIPLSILFLTGSGLTGLGIKFRKRK